MASHEGHYCPNSTAVLTCTASQVTSLAWFAQDKKIGTIYVSCNVEIEDGPYNINLTSCAVDGNHANFTSVMEGVWSRQGESPPKGGVAMLPITFSGVACCGSCPRSLRDLRVGL